MTPKPFLVHTEYQLIVQLLTVYIHQLKSVAVSESVTDCHEQNESVTDCHERSESVTCHERVRTPCWVRNVANFVQFWLVPGTKFELDLITRIASITNKFKLICINHISYRPLLGWVMPVVTLGWAPGVQVQVGSPNSSPLVLPSPSESIWQSVASHFCTERRRQQLTHCYLLLY